MSRFKVIKSKGRYYVVTADSNGLAGGPYSDSGEADDRANWLAVLEARQAAKAAKPKVHSMNITPGYRSADVEDGRGVAAVPDPILRAMPPSFVKWNTPDGKPLPPGFVPAWKKHNIPIDPDERTPSWEVDEFGDWVKAPPRTAKELIREPVGPVKNYPLADNWAPGWMGRISLDRRPTEPSWRPPADEKPPLVASAPPWMPRKPGPGGGR